MQHAALRDASFAFCVPGDAMKSSACRKDIGSRIRGSVKQTRRD